MSRAGGGERSFPIGIARRVSTPALVLAWLIGSAAPRAAAQPPPRPDGGAHAPETSPRPHDAAAAARDAAVDRDAATTRVDADVAGEGVLSDAAAGAAPLPAEHRPELSLSLDPDQGITTGDAVTLSIRAVVPEGTDVAVPEQDFAPFDILDKRHTTRDSGDGEQVFEFELELLALEPGDAELGPIGLRVVTADGVVGRVRTEPIRIRVESVLGNEPNPEPKGRTAPVTVMEEDYTLLWILGGLGAIVLIALATLLIARWWRRRAKPAAPAPPPRPPWDVAFEKLEALRRDRSAAIEEGRVEDWADRLSDALREYFGHRYGFEGLESTTDEVIGRLRNQRLRGTSIPEVSSILGECDLVKFARATLDESRFDALVDDAVRIIRNTMPGSDHAAGGGAGDGRGDARDEASSRTGEPGAATGAPPATDAPSADQTAAARDAEPREGGSS